MGVDPFRHREQLIRGLDDNGLEELTLRYVKPEHPLAHRTRRGVDGGIDVLSDYTLTPQRAWQCKTSTNAQADWTECRNSIKAAMGGAHPPAHYTFVFNFTLSAGQRDFWRATLLPELSSAYPQCTTIDYIDDLHQRVDGRDDLLDWLTDGAYGSYVRRTLNGLHTATNPGDTFTIAQAHNVFTAAADHAVHLGKTDPGYSYSVAGREATTADRAIADQAIHISMSAGQRDQLPTFSLTARDGDAATELSATARDGATLEPPQPWFAPNPEGARARAHARAELAKGRDVSLTGPHIGVSGGDVPEQLATWFAPDDSSPEGTLGIATSHPLTLTITLEPAGGPPVPIEIPIYRVPAEPGASIAYAGAIGAAILGIDLVPVPDTAQPSDRGAYECRLTVTFAMSGEAARQAVTGLGFARAFGEVERIHLTCPGLLPADGYEITDPRALGPEEDEIWQVAATLALALNGLTERDGVLRTMPEEVNGRDRDRAEKILTLLSGPIEAMPDTTIFDVVLPPWATAEDDPQGWLELASDFGELANQPSNLIVRRSITGAQAIGIREVENGPLVLTCEQDTIGRARIVIQVDETST